MYNYVKGCRSQNTWHDLQAGLYVLAASTERYNKCQKRNDEVWGWVITEINKSIIYAFQMDLKCFKVY